MPLRENDVIIPAFLDLFWHQTGGGSSRMYHGPIVIQEADRYSPREQVHRVYTLFSKSPDIHSDLWVISPWPLEPSMVKEHTCFLPLRFEGYLWQEGIERAKGYLVDWCIPGIPLIERINVEWAFVEISDVWAIKVGSRYHTFGPARSSERHTRVLGLTKDTDPLVALAEAAKATNERRFA